MSIESQIALLKELIETAQSNLKSAKKILTDLMGGDLNDETFAKAASSLNKEESGNDGDKIIEGIFDGQNMIDANKKVYSVPANYASKSKLIPGDILKLTIKPDGAFLYKQISPAERKRVKGPLVSEDGQFQVLVNNKAYNVLLASVTYFHANEGDEITLIIPSAQDSDWGAIENVLAK
ncbi:hypothetical protein A2483_04205 [Candidatus Peregrinibacteria bacterium RIFOXYC2_FULL_33_13]|nr:MAG: 50S ribosomal protein L7/L12 [Candidatus Peregrinibacteria bacterium GW2011_GWC2_33_13]OGJ52724.1 MAG: hypothetical protein A2483_04205 [Candidatus Peregrinibacteria bacterium RIFOXYC2_FULL_33_13]